MTQVYIHFGLHKTGTTSIQNWLRSVAGDLEARGILYYEGLYKKNNHVELGLSVIRDHLDIPVRRRFAEQRQHYFDTAQAHIANLCQTTDHDTMILSNETLSFCREQEEIDRLKDLFGPDCEITPILFLRDKTDWLRSLRAQIGKRGFPESDDPRSCTYFGADSWLLDHEDLVELLRSNFERVIVVEYGGNSVEQFQAALNLPAEVTELRRNVSKSPEATEVADKKGSWLRKIGRKLFAGSASGRG